MKEANFSQDIVFLRSLNPNPHKKYWVTIIDACYTNAKTELKILFELRDRDTGFVFHILETLKTDSSEYVERLQDIYFNDGTEAICVNLEDFASYSAECRILPGCLPKIDWTSVVPWEKPISRLDEYEDNDCNSYKS